eukprot:CAMPEP_0170498720 /NCGR_PEP_ID=MMETSP0208-20121228/28772_1 /TAXON_ID=197538 /ORGANISM="Strombidium inclinatum, Strain S3" /LENGTH=76 /DNA_ID=CAMNT_0010775979 /DNA_START=328 /DNA_END=558 /DNA_ORIENTATION=-
MNSQIQQHKLKERDSRLQKHVVVKPKPEEKGEEDVQDSQNEEMEDDYFDHDYEDEEQLFSVLSAFKQLGGNLLHVK